MVRLEIRLVLEDPGDHRAIRNVAADRGIDRRIDGAGRAAGRERERAECEIVVPRDHLEHAVLLIKIVVVHHAAGVAVAVDEEIVHGEIAHHRIGVHDGRVALGKRLQRFNQALLIVGIDLRLRGREDVGIALRVVVDVLELDVARAHAAGGEAVRRFRAAGGIIASQHCGETGEIGRVREIGLYEFIRFVHGIKIEIREIEVAAVSASAAVLLAVRLVEIAGAVAAGQKRVLHALDREIQPPVRAVYGDPDVAAFRAGHAHAVHQRVGEVVLHHGFVLNQVVQAELIEAVIGLRGIIVVEFELQAVAVVSVLLNGRKRRIALCANGDVGILFAVDQHGAGNVFLAGAVFDKGFPIVHRDIDAVHARGVEQAL